MMGRRNQRRGQLFYEFRLDEAVPDDHLVRKIRTLLELSWVYAELSSYNSETGRPSIDPVLMIRMLIIGYVFAIRSERLICRKVQVNLAYRWFCDLGLENAIPDHSAFSRVRNERFRASDIFRRVVERVVGSCIEAGLVGGEGFAVDASLIEVDANRQFSLDIREITRGEWFAGDCALRQFFPLVGLPSKCACKVPPFTMNGHGHGSTTRLTPAI